MRKKGAAKLLMVHKQKNSMVEGQAWVYSWLWRIQLNQKIKRWPNFRFQIHYQQESALGKRKQSLPLKKAQSPQNPLTSLKLLLIISPIDQQQTKRGNKQEKPAEILHYTTLF